MRFQITGANAETGDDVDVMLDAPSQSDVERIAHDKGILVSAIKPINATGGGMDSHGSRAGSRAGSQVGMAGVGNGHGSMSGRTAVAAPPAPAVHAKGDLSAISLIDDAPDADGTPHAAGVITVSAGSPGGTAQSAAGHIAEQKPGDAAMEYHIMLNQSLYLLETAVNKQLRDGWEPQGGMAVAVSNNALQYFQALVRKKKVGDPPAAPHA